MTLIFYAYFDFELLENCADCSVPIDRGVFTCRREGDILDNLVIVHLMKFYFGIAGSIVKKLVIT